MAGEITGKLGYDCGRFRLSASPILNIALRARKLDQVAQEFIARHPDAVGLDLGAGLDTRAFRINPPPTVDWYDIDYPQVITADTSCSPTAPTPTPSVPTSPTPAGWTPSPPAGRR